MQRQAISAPGHAGIPAQLRPRAHASPKVADGACGASHDLGCGCDDPADAAGWSFLLGDATPLVVSLLANTLEALVVQSENALASVGADLASPEPSFADFHAARPPAIPIASYLERIHRYAHCSPVCFVAAFAFLDRAARRGSRAGTLPLTRHNVHRLLMTAIMVAAKFLDDAFYNNAYYARVGGISTEEINRLELRLLALLDFRLHVLPEELRRYAEHLYKASNGVGVYAMAVVAAPAPAMEPSFAAMAVATAIHQQQEQAMKAHVLMGGSDAGLMYSPALEPAPYYPIHAAAPVPEASSPQGMDSASTTPRSYAQVARVGSEPFG